MESEFTFVEIENRVATLFIDRPKKLNALNKQTIQELHHMLNELDTDENIRVIILTGNGEKAFVAGADIAEFSDFGEAEGKELAKRGQELLFDFIANLSTPVIAAVNGFALGGGLELAMASHIRIASSNARMGLPEVSLGLIPGYGGTQRLTQLVGKGKAMEMILSGAMINAEDALKWGLVNKVVSGEELLSSCQQLAEKIAFNSGTAIASGTRSGA